MSLSRSKDRKTTNLPTPDGKAPRIKNSFGLPAGRAYTCPGATSTCQRVCYAGRLENGKGVREAVARNYEQLKGRDRPGMAALLAEMIDDFRGDCNRARSNGATVPLAFRIHWDGDFFSLPYAQAWADVIRGNADIRFWVYTRSFNPATLDVLPALRDLPNLTVYLSVDPDNVVAAAQARKRNPWVRWAYLAETFASGSADLAAVAGKRYPCPENGGRIPLISEKGSACIRCGICPSGRGDVIFSIAKR